MIWDGVSSAISQSRHVGFGYLIGSKRLLCLLRKQWPVIHLAAWPNESLSSLRRERDFVGVIVGKNILVCLYSGESFHFWFHFLNDSIIDDVFNVWFGVWDMGIVGVGIWWKTGGGSCCALFC